MLGWIDTIVQGVLLGGLYSLYATGLSVIFGIMRLSIWRMAISSCSAPFSFWR
jgi:branched-subunit amino acid ABC-type transport system permease component